MMTFHRTSCTALALASMLLGHASIVRGMQDDAKPKEYKILKVADGFSDEKQFKERFAEKKQMIRGLSPYNNAAVKLIYEGYFLPKMSTAGTSEFINEVRTAIFADLYDANKSDKLRAEDKAEFLKVVYDTCLKGMESTLHPATRVNSMLIIGQMDEKLSSSTTPPVPYRESLKVLAKEVSEPTSDGTLAVALNGLERHVRLGGLKKSNQAEIVGRSLMKLVTDPTAVGRTREVNSFLQRRCLDILTQLDGQDYTAARDYMLAVAADGTAEPYLRGYCIRALGQERAVKGVDSALTNKATAGAVQYAYHELEVWMKKLNEESPSSLAGGGAGGGGSKFGRGGGMGAGGLAGGDGPPDAGGGMGGFGNQGAKDDADESDEPGEKLKEDPIKYQPPEVRIARRALTTILENVRMGLDGAPKAKSTAKKYGLLNELQDNAAAGKDFLNAIDSMHEAINYSGEYANKKIRDMATLRKIVNREFKRKIAPTAKAFPGAMDIGIPAELLATNPESESPEGSGQ